MLDCFADFREFERFLFRSVPEHPEPVWERGSYAITGERQTGRSQLLRQQPGNRITSGEVIATIKYDHIAHKINISWEKPQHKVPSTKPIEK